MKRDFMGLRWAIMLFLVLTTLVGGCATTMGNKGSSHCCCDSCCNTCKGTCSCSSKDSCGCGATKSSERPCGDCGKDYCMKTKGDAKS